MGNSRRRLRILMRRVLRTADSPPRTAAAFSLGLFLGISPFLGIHTLLALVLAFVLRLNRLAVLLGTFVLNPWTLVPIYGAGTGLGLALLRRGHADVVTVTTALRDASGFREALAAVHPVLGPFVVGNLVLGAAVAGVAYPLTLRVIRRMRARRERARSSRSGVPRGGSA